MQSRDQVVPLRKSSAVIFALCLRPQKGSRGYYRVNMRHGVSRLHGGRRLTAGIIFHDATYLVLTAHPCRMGSSHC